MSRASSSGEFIPMPRVSGSTYARLSSIERRQDGEAEARAHLAGQFHEALADLVEFAQEAHVAITLSEANINALTRDLARLTDLFEQYMKLNDERVTAGFTAMRAVWDVTKPRPSIWRRLFA